MNFILKLLRFFLVLVILLIVAVAVAGFSVYRYYANDLPKLDSLKDYNPPVISEVYSDDGTKIGEFWTEKRIVLSPKELPKGIVQAIVASEDDRFFEHKGLDYWGIVRAFLENLKAGQVVQGGSTITQQVTKSLLLTRDRTIERKIKEAILATRLEQNFNKDEILYLYLNQTFFGNRAYGIEAAARNYFHKTAKELNVAEAAMIAGLAKAPTTYSPIINPERAKSRQEYVIERMYEVGYITREQADQAKKTPLKVFRATTDKEFNVKHAPWFTEFIRQYVQQKYGDQVPYTHGLQIHTTLSLATQNAAQNAVMRGLIELDKRQGYKGPIKKLDSSEFDSFSEQNHISIMRGQLDTVSLESHIPTDDELLKSPLQLLPKKNYQAVITAVDRKNLALEVRIGSKTGLIRSPDYGWARTRNTNTSGHDGVQYIKDPQSTFKVGDVITVNLKTPSADEEKSKGYVSGQTYFSLEQWPEVEGALFSYEPQTGFVKAIVGGKDFGESEFNRAMQAIRQTGSAIKPLIYAAALDKGYTPSSVIDDSPIYYEYSPGRFWSPQNYGGGYKGPTTFRSALVNSRNVVSVKILMDIGLDFTDAYARKLGITTPIKRVYSMALGANDMKLFELCRAYGTFVTGGILPDLVYVKQMTDRFGRVLEQYQPKEIIPFQKQLEAKAKSKSDKVPDKGKEGFRPELLTEGEKWLETDKLKLHESEKKILYGDYIPEGYTLSPRTAYTMVSLMHDIVNYGTGYKVKELKRPAAGKTGTTNDETDTWFVGFTPELFAGVWVGFDKVQKIGSHETGGKTSAPIFLYYMQEALKDKPVAQFEIPKEINLDALDAPVDTSPGDAEAGGIGTGGSGGGGGADFFIHDF